MTKHGRPRYRILGYVFIAIGLVGFIPTAFLAPAIAGTSLGAFLIGLLLAYLSFVPTVQPELLGAVLMPTANNLEALFRRFHVSTQATYICPDGKPSSLRVFVPFSADASPRPTEFQIADQIPVTQSNVPSGLLFEPPGAGLLAMLEHERDQDIGAIELTGLEEALSSGIVKSLELGTSVRLAFEGSEVRFMLKDDLFWEFSQKLAQEAPIFCERIGCPICSLVACALAKSSHRDVRFLGAKHTHGEHRASFELLD